MFEKSGGEFLNIRYPDLQKSEQVSRSVDKKARLEGIKTLNNPKDRNEVFLDRLENIFENPNEKTRERNIKLFKNKFIYPEVLIDKNNVPDSYFELQIKKARERNEIAEFGGYKKAEEIPQNIKNRYGETLYKDQKKSLDNWFDYLSSSDSSYPTWFKYYTLKSVSKMGVYDKGKHEFNKRTKNTTTIFPDLNREALSYTYDVLEKHYLKHEKHDDEELKKIVDSANFSKIYAFAIDKVTPASKENKEKIEGEWTKFNQGDDATALYESLQGHGTGWCTAGEETARTQLKNGDFYIYYSKDQEGNNTIPRIAIRMENRIVAEVRGINKDQNLEGNMTNIAKEKYQQLPGGEKFDKKDHDMKLLTLIDKKIKDNQELLKEELRFLYEIDSNIEGFGYQKDPRIKELCGTRDPKKDMLIVLNCTQEQIAHNQKEINQNTKVYVGQLFSGIFNQLSSNIEYIYTSFPENKITRNMVVIGGESVKKLEQRLQKADIMVSSRAKKILNNNKFKTLKTSEEIELVKLQVSDFGFTNCPTINELYQRANEFGLDICPAEIGPRYRLKYKDQSLNEQLFIGMKQLNGSGDNPYVFKLEHEDGGLLWLNAGGVYPTDELSFNYMFVFHHRKLGS